MFDRQIMMEDNILIVLMDLSFISESMKSAKKKARKCSGVLVTFSLNKNKIPSLSDTLLMKNSITKRGIYSNCV